MDTSIPQKRERHRQAHAVYRDRDYALMIRLRENEIDLQTEIMDLSAEIISREARLLEALAALRQTRAQMRHYLQHIEWGGDAA